MDLKKTHSSLLKQMPSNANYFVKTKSSRNVGPFIGRNCDHANASDVTPCPGHRIRLSVK